MSFRERIFHMILFEVTLLVVCALAVACLTNHDVATVSGIVIALSVIAMLCNFGYNWLFDQFIKGKREARRFTIRAIHAIGFETCLLIFSLPIIAWGLGIGLWEAFLLDIGLTLLTVIYTFAFNWVYDHARLYFTNEKTADK